MTGKTNAEIIKFNLNDWVRVKLTDHGRHILLRKALRDREEFPALRSFPYKPPVEDAEGWSKWQLWSLISEFGEHVGLGLDNPFELDIELLKGSW